MTSRTIKPFSIKVILVVTVLCFLGKPAAAQVYGFEPTRNAIRETIQGFHCTFWDGNHVIIDGVSDRDATEIYVPDNICSNGHAFKTGEIGAMAFRDMRRLTRCSFLVWNVLVNAFTGCEALRVIESRNADPPGVGQHMFYYGSPTEVFEDYHFLTTAVVVPAGSEQAYRKAHGWREFHTIVSHEPTFDDYDHEGIRHSIAELEHELDSLSGLEQRLRLEMSAQQQVEPEPTTTPPLQAPPAQVSPKPKVEQAERFPIEGVTSTEHIALKIMSGGVEYKTRFTPDIIITCHIDTTAVHVVLPDSVQSGDRRYAVTKMCEEAFASHGHLISLSLPAGLTNVAPEAFRGCNQLRLLEMRSTVPPAFGSIDNGACAPDAVFDDQQFARVTLVVPSGSEQAYRSDPGWSKFHRIVTSRPALDALGITPVDERLIELDAQLCRIDARKKHIRTALQALQRCEIPTSLIP